MKTFVYSLIFALGALVTQSCSGSTEEMVENNLREAEMAVAQGDMRAAESVTRHIVGSKALENFTPSQLGRLSLIYMHLADSTDADDPVSRATECYRAAFAVDSDSASAFYANVPPEHTAHAMLLSAIVHSTDLPADSLHLDD